MKLVSKLSSTAYKTIPLEEALKWIKFLPGVDGTVDPVFIMRLGAFAKDHGMILELSDGYRSVEAQAVQYFKYGGKYDKVKGYYYPDSVPKSERKAAKPGTSHHNFHFAVDFGSTWAREIDKNAATISQKTLAKYGLCKPLTLGNKTKLRESWHVIPIEAAHLTASGAKHLFPTKIA